MVCLNEIKIHFEYFVDILTNFLSKLFEKVGFNSINKGYLFLDTIKTSSKRGIGDFFRLLIFLIFALDHFVDYLDYSYKYKSVYLMLIVSFVAVVYLILCYLSGVLKIENFKSN